MNDTPAFPHTWLDPQLRSSVVAKGMTLRDYFAAKAMQAMIKYGPWSDYVDMEQIARLAYQQADAMMAARSAE
jgi:phenylacetate-coenzyme A ligase PaaK-like adenylate-forming protein